MRWNALFFTITIAGLTIAGAARAEVPFFNAVCPGNVEVHADDGGPIYVNGRETKLRRFNNNYYEAKLESLTISVTVRPDGTPDISYTKKGGVNGVCNVRPNGAASAPRVNSRMAGPPPRAGGADIDLGTMPAFCRGAAAEQFDRRPSEITTSMAFRSGNRIVVQGNYAERKKTTFFNCWFDRDGNFMSVN